MRCQTNFTLAIMILGLFTLLLFYTWLPKGVSLFDDHTHYLSLLTEPSDYNATYPLTQPVVSDSSNIILPLELLKKASRILECRIHFDFPLQ